MKRIAPVAAAFFLALAACSPGEESSAPDEPVITGTSGGDASDESTTDLATVEGAIPARYLGVWDYVDGTCSPESDMRMEIAPREITFYESYGAVSDVIPDGEDVIADLAMEGEGETWTNKLRLSLVEVDGETQLHTSDGTEPEVIDQYPRKKCG